MTRWCRRPAPVAPIRFWPARGRPRSRFTGTSRTLALAMVVALIWPTLDPTLIEPPACLSTEPEVADRSFGRCGLDRTHACVVDGDTFRIGKRRVRIVGIDVPEVNARFE